MVQHREPLAPQQGLQPLRPGLAIANGQILGRRAAEDGDDRPVAQLVGRALPAAQSLRIDMVLSRRTRRCRQVGRLQEGMPGPDHLARPVGGQQVTLRQVVPCQGDRSEAQAQLDRRE